MKKVIKLKEMEARAISSQRYSVLFLVLGIVSILIGWQSWMPTGITTLLAAMSVMHWVEFRYWTTKEELAE